MAFSACEEVLLTSLQNVFSTSVGVSFAYPILSQIIDIKNENTLKECSRVMKIAAKNHGSSGVSHLGGEKIQYQFKLNGLAILNTYLTALSAVIGIVAFILLIASSVNPLICVNSTTSFAICMVLSLPFALGIFQLVRWYDAHSQLLGAISYYRGDYKWRSKKTKPD